MKDLNIQWFPGHMMKTQRIIESNIKLIDIVAELTDARLPEAGRNPVLDSLAAGKPRVLLLNKRDYADETITSAWVSYYKARGLAAVACDCRSGAGLAGILPLLKSELDRHEAAKGTVRKYKGAIRVMAAGIPNSGKSSFINRMAGGKKAAVGDRPGVTRGKQWVAAAGKGGITAEILDLPGILPPKIEEPQAAMFLAYTGAVKDAVMDSCALAANLAEFLAANHPEKLCARYKLHADLLNGEESGDVLLTAIAKARGMMISGGEPDSERAAAALLDDFRGGRIGRITLEKPPVGGF